jgi:DNA primase
MRAMANSNNKKELTVEQKTEALTKLIEFCSQHLSAPQGKRVLNYLRKDRGLSDETIEKFKLGAFPPFADVASTYMGHYAAWKLGVVGLGANGQFVSKFVTHNVIIPIYDTNGLPVAIIGRSLLSEAARQKAGLAKYINSYFKKTANLFGLNLAKTSARQSNELILVEGNFDVITAHQNGIQNIAGVSNAHISKSQISLASRYASNIRLGLDRDEAGQLGCKKALASFGNLNGISLSALSWPEDVKDLDELFKKGYTVRDLK